MAINLEKNEDSNERSLVLSEAAIDSLKKTAPWTKFISILGLILGVFFIIGAFALFFSKGMLAYAGSTMGILYLILAFVFLRIHSLLYNYSNELKIINYDSSLDYAFEMQQKFWKYNGILAIVYISFVLLAFLSFIIGDLIH